MSRLAPASGKTQALLHDIDRRLGAHKGAGRVWLEGKRLVDAGFRQGVRYQVAPGDGTLELRLSRAGDHTVSHKDGRPVVDVLTRALGPVERVQVRFYQGAIHVSLHPLDEQARVRLARLNARLASGGRVRLGSVCHGGGVASDALLRGLGASSELRLVIEQDARYMAQSLRHGPASTSSSVVTLEQDLGDVDPADVVEVDVLEAGLPCISASRAGRSKKGLETPEDDDATVDLAAAFLEVVRAAQPALIVLENVVEYRDSASAKLIRRRLGRWGYQLQERVLDGSEWSLEARTRWVLVASLRGLDVDLDSLVPTARPATLGEVLDRKVPATEWRAFDYLDRKQARDQAKGNKFTPRVLTPASVSVPTLRRGYHKVGSTDPLLAHPTRPGLKRRLTPAEHARVKGIPARLVQGLDDGVAHEVLGQSVIAPSFVALGAALAASVR